MTYDLLVTHGRVVDGCGTPWYQADLGIKSGRIARIGRLAGARAQRVIDAGGKIVAPGFIDMMGQTAKPFLRNPQAANNLLAQGVTTLLAGEGVSDAPLPAGDARTNGWRTMREYLTALEKRGLPMNVAYTVGHTQVRRLVLGNKDRAPTPDDLEQMKQLVREAMEAGAIGLSTALIYPPAVYASTEELEALCAVAGQYGGRYYTHIRNEGDRLIEAIDEALTIGAGSATPVHIFHLKAAGKANWGKMDLALARIKAARAAGQDVDADFYPYLHNGLSLDSFVHPRHFAQGDEAWRRKVDSREERAVMRREMESTEGWENWFRHCGGNWDKVIVTQIRAPAYRSYEGRSIGEIGRGTGKDPWDVFWDLARSGAFALPETMSEANKLSTLKESFVSVCTDIGPAIGSNMAGHPRAYGSFARILGRYVREWHVISLEEAVARMSALAANQILAYDRGRIAPGQAADLVIFDAENVQDRATFSKPNALAEGVQAVMVNGQVVWDQGKFTGALPGKVLRGPGYRSE